LELRQVQLLHPLCMLWVASAFVVSALFVHTLSGLTILIFALITICCLTNTRIDNLLLSALKYWPIFLMTFVIHIMLSNRIAAYSIHGLVSNFMNTHVLDLAFFFTARMFLMVVAVALLFRVHPPQYYGQAVGRALSKLPFGRIFWTQLDLTGTLVLRFIPFLQDEAVRLKMALAARGLAPADRWRTRLTGFEKLLFPLIISSLRRADNTALALEARGFNPTIRRTYYHDSSLTLNGILLTFVFTVFCAAAPLV
jgi:energy-coupling factor transport system permease protein